MKIIVFLVLATCISCERRTLISSNNANVESRNSVFTSNTPGQSNHLTDKKKPENHILDRRAAEYGLVPLTRTNLGADDYELRIWSSVSNSDSEPAYETCLILSRKEDSWNGKIIKPVILRRKDAPHSKQKVAVETKEIVIAEPYWPVLEDLIRDAGLYPPLSYSTNTHSTPVVDGGVISVEVKRGDKYDLVEFSAFTKSLDGQSIIDVCRNIEEILHVKIGCEHH